MKAVLQRVTKARITIDKRETRFMGHGMVILLGIEEADTDEDIQWLVHKIINLRIFDDGQGVMNLSLTDVDGEALIVSQFTLHARVKKGNRPSYIDAAHPDTAIPLYEAFVKLFRETLGRPVVTGEFGANMDVELVNYGPVTIIIDTKNKL